MHANASGFSIKITDIDKLYNYANEKLKNINFNEGFYEADFIVGGNCSYLENLIFDLNKGKSIYGQGCPEPLIAIENIPINIESISIIGTNKDTLRFEFNGITYIKFKATKLIEKLKDFTGKVKITVVGKSNINEWGGYRKPQILIEEMEINQSNEFDF